MSEWMEVGRPGHFGKTWKKKTAEYDGKYGKGNWRIAYVIGADVITRNEALQYYEDGYFYYLKNHPELLEWLVTNASDVYDNAKSNLESGTDYFHQEASSTHLQDIAIRRVIKRLGKEFEGDQLIQIRGKKSEGYMLSPGVIPFHKPEIIRQPPLKGWWNSGTIEDFWQSNKILQVKKNR